VETTFARRSSASTNQAVDEEVRLWQRRKDRRRVEQRESPEGRSAALLLLAQLANVLSGAAHRMFLRAAGSLKGNPAGEFTPMSSRRWLGIALALGTSIASCRSAEARRGYSQAFGEHLIRGIARDRRR
jgi:hypothetical protein